MNWIKDPKLFLSLEKDGRSLSEKQDFDLPMNIKTSGESVVRNICLQAPSEAGIYSAIFKVNDLTQDIGKSISVGINVGFYEATLVQKVPH